MIPVNFSLGVVEGSLPVWFVPTDYFGLMLLSIVGLVCFLRMGLPLFQVLTILNLVGNMEGRID